MSEIPSGERPKGQGVIGYKSRSLLDVLLRRPRTPIVSYEQHFKAMTAGFLALLQYEETLKTLTNGDQPIAQSQPISSPTSSSV
jgi:hypothetical protein